MPIERENKMILLFVSSDNPLWKEIMGSDALKATNIFDIIKISHSTIPNWKKAGKVSATTANNVFSNTIAYLERIGEIISGKKDIVEKIDLPKNEKFESCIKKNHLTTDKIESCIHRVHQFKAAYFAPNINIYEAANILLMDIDKCQKIIDEAIYERHPIFPNMYHDFSKTTAEFNRFKGMYYAFVRRGKICLRCTLRVRYVLKIRDGNTIRCKLNIPIIDDDQHLYWEYDGFLIVRDRALFWFFEKREQNRIDYFSFITANGRSYQSISSAASAVKKYTLAGTYLTTDQDSGQSVVTGSILLQRESMDDIKRIENAMGTDIAILEGDELIKFDNNLVDFQNGGTGNLAPNDIGLSTPHGQNVMILDHPTDRPD